MTSLNYKNNKIYLVNPPNKKIVLRDLYSSTISKGYYNWPNVDLLCLSGNLSKNFQVEIIDANTLGYSVEKTIKIILKNKKTVGVIVAIGKSVISQDYHFV